MNYISYPVGRMMKMMTNLQVTASAKMQRRLLLLLLLNLPAKIVQRLDMPKAFAGDGTEGQRTEKVD